MTSRSNRRLLLLFVVAVLLPCAVLIGMSVRSMRQDRELAQKRLAEDRARSATEARSALLSRLEALKAQALATPPSLPQSTQRLPSTDPAIRLVADIRGGRLVLPWERTPRATVRRDSVLDEKLRDAEHAEFVERDAAKASALLKEATKLGLAPGDEGLVRLALARTDAKVQDVAGANAQYLRVLTLGPEFRDEQGVPFSLYAASRLAASEGAAVVERLSRTALESCCLGPEALYMLRAVLDTALAHGGNQRDSATSGLRRVVDERIRIAEQSRALQADFPTLGLALPRSAPVPAPRWMTYGSESWFVSVATLDGSAARAASSGAALVALDVNAVLDEVNRQTAASPGLGGRLRPPAQSDGGARLLAAGLSEIPVVYSTTGDAAAPGRRAGSFFVAAVLVVLGVTLFGAYLLWFDVGRELRLAELRSQFVSSVSHELKTPLTSIRMFAETLLLERSEEPGQRREYLGTIVHESERLTRLLNNVLDLAKIERGQKSYRFAPVALDDVVLRCARTMEYPLAQQGFSLHVEADADMPPVPADEDAIQQAVLNLLTNAMKYSGDSRAIDLTLRRLNGDAVVEVTDRGVGIRPQHIGRVVEKFYRAPTTDNERIPGTGLGLTLVDHIVKAHGGRLVIHSEPGRGSTIGIHLPLGDRA